MAFRKSGFNHHRFITILIVVLAVIGIGITVLASQQKTQTESDAAGSACAKKPTLLPAEPPKIFNTYIEYTIRIKNNDYTVSGCRQDAFDISVTKPADNWESQFLAYRTRRHLGYNQFIQELDQQQSRRFILKVSAPANARRGRTFDIIVKATNMINLNNYDELILKYTTSLTTPTPTRNPLIDKTI